MDCCSVTSRGGPALDHAADAGSAHGLKCLSIDVEEYFQCEAFAARVDPRDWPGFQRRAEPCLEQLGALLDRYDSRATLFVLGWMVPHLAPLLRELIRRGHELACHGDAHEHLSRLNAQQLREDLHRARGRIEDALGVCPRGYRAPTFSITRDTAWAFDVVIAAGFQYDASIFPIHHDRYGVPDAPLTPFWAVAPSGARILEFPPLAIRCGGIRLPVGGGGYLRLLPGAFVRRCVAARARHGAPVMIYLHPWELDPDQPRLPAGWLAQWRHRVNLRTTAAKVERLLQAFRFDTATAVLQRVGLGRDLPVFELARPSPGGQSASNARLV